MSSFTRRMMKAMFLLSIAGSVWAGGFSIYEQGARATAQAGAVVARPYDLSTAFYNPAGLVQIGAPGEWRFYGGLTPVQSLSKFQGSYPAPGNVRDAAKTKWFPPFNMYVGYNINDKMAAALAIYTPFGLGTEWKQNFSGRFRSIGAEIQTVYISPTFAYKVNDMMSFGVAVDYIFSKVALERNSAAAFTAGPTVRTYDVIKVKLHGEDKGTLGFHLGGYFKPTDKLSVGVDYKHLVHQVYKGEATFSQIRHAKTAADTIGNLVVDPAVAARLANPLFGGAKQDGNAKYINFPNSLTVGVAYQVNEKLSVEADYSFVGWSTFKQIVIEFPENAGLAATGVDNKSIIEENYKNAWQVRLGAEYAINEKFFARAGYIYDNSPAPTNTISPLLPDADRNDFSIGLGYKVNDAVHIDCAYMAVIFKERSTNNSNVDHFDGTFNSHVNLFALGVGYTFGK